MKTLQMQLKTLIGTIYLVGSQQGLHGIFWDKQNVPMMSEKSDPADKAILIKTATQLEEYFNRKRKTFDIPLVVEGTSFQKKVWKALSRIPYGKTCSYKDIATNIRHENAYRAVGTANGNNPHAIIVPCHRVISADGTLGGYAGGLDIKQILLNLEGICL